MISWTKLLFDTNSWGDSIRFSGSTKPVVVWNITADCNLYCRHCYLDAKSSPSYETVSTDDAKRIIIDLAAFKVPAILFSGGEPLLREDIFSLAEFAHNLGIRPALSTNGTLITPSVAKKINMAKFAYIGVSIDGSPRTHNRLRGDEASFKKSVSGIRNSKAQGIKTGLRFTLIKENLNDLEFIFDLAQALDVDRLCIYHLVYSGRANKELDISPDERRNALELISKYTKDFYRKKHHIEILTVNNAADGIWLYRKLQKIDPLYAQEVLRLLLINGGNRSGISLGCIDYKADVYADQFLRNVPLGNLFKTPFSEIWQDEENQLLYKLRRRKEFINGRCKACNAFSLCNGNMRARAQTVFSDMWGDDPSCYLSDEERNDGFKSPVLGGHAVLQS